MRTRSRLPWAPDDELSPHEPVPLAGFASGTKTQSLTVPFQSLILTFLISTTITRTPSPATKWPVAALLLASPCWRFRGAVSSNVLFSRCLSVKNFSSSEPDGASLAAPPMVALMLEMAEVLRLRSREARLERCSGPGEPPEGRRPCVGGRWETPKAQHVSIVSTVDPRVTYSRGQAGRRWGLR